MTPAIAHPEKILIIRLSAIGDLVMASPIIDVLRSAYPEAKIGWLVQAEFSELLAAHPGLDTVIEWPRRQWTTLLRARRFITLAREIKRFVRELRQAGFDTVIDIQGLLKSALWARLSGATTRIGLDCREGSGALMTQVVTSPGGDPRIGSEYRALIEALGLAAGDFPMSVAVNEDDERHARALIEAQLPAGEYAVLCPYTTRPQKHWFGEQWVQLANRLESELGLAVVVLGGPGDAAAAAELVARTTRGINLAGCSTLRQSAAVIKAARLLIGVDTGMTHTALAFDVPSVALFGSTRPYLDTGSPRAQIIYKDLPCSPCRRHPTCDGAFTCMRDITAAEVFATARTLVDDTATGS